MAFRNRMGRGNARVVFAERLETRTLFSAGAVDPSFNSSTPLPLLDVSATAADPNGKLLIAGPAPSQGQNLGSVGIVRLEPNGDIDTSFGTNGAVLLPFVGANQSVVVNAVAVQADGKVIIAGFNGTIIGQQRGGPTYGAEAPFIARLTVAGKLDTTFASGGKLTPIIANTVGLAVSSSGKIFYAGDAGTGTAQKFDVVRLNANGTTDTTYGTQGLANVNFGKTIRAHDINLESDGKVVVAGDELVGSADNTALARFTASGAADNTFGIGGKVVTADGTGDIDSALQSDNKIVVSGSNANDGWIERFNANGSLDTTFGVGGHVVSPLPGTGPVALQSNGEIIAGGQDSSGIPVALYKPNGTLDTSFGTGGIAIATQQGIPFFGVQSIAVQSSGRIFVAGFSDSSEPVADLAMARFLGTHVTLAGGTPAVTTGTTVGADPRLAGSVIASQNLNFSAGSGASAVSGQLQEWVEKETASGTLDFYFRIVNASGSAAGIASLVASNFYGFTTYVDYRPDSAGTIAPVTASRSTDHKSIAFNFVAAPAGVGAVAPGTSSYASFIKTNATHFSTGGKVLLNNVISLAGYEAVV